MTPLLLIALANTAHPDPQVAANIPEPEQNSTEAPAELPVPYAPWQGRGFAPPTAAAEPDLPPPLARPHEQARRPIELSAALSAFLPSCGSGSIDDRACLTLSPGTGVEAALLYRTTPFFAFGVEAALSGFGNGRRGALSSSGGGARFLGVAGRVYFADAGDWDPYLGLTLGVGVLKLRSPDDAEVATSGLGGRVEGGVDYRFGSHVRLGPSASLSRWFAYGDARCEQGVCRDESAAYGHVLGFATLGLRLSIGLGEAL